MSWVDVCVLLKSKTSNEKRLVKKAELALEKQQDHMDFWRVEEVVSVQSLLEDGSIYFAIVTPEGEWIEGPWYMISIPIPVPLDVIEWGRKCTDLLQKNNETNAVIVSCHV